MESSLTVRGLAEAPDRLAGHVVKGNYQVIEEIARGGMGIVYRATQLPLGRTVALKTLHSDDPQLAQRFFREAKTLSQINHPNIVQLIEYGTTESGMCFLVMEFLTGHNLEKAVPKEQGLPLGTTLELIEQMCAGLETVHRHQLVHRDLKPANIFLAHQTDDTVFVKLLDFGIAKVLEGEEGPLTQQGTILGSCGYMAPEQITGSANIDARADVYALGGILYFMLTGHAAYQGKHTAEILTKQLMHRPQAPDFQALGKPEAAPLLPVILKAMELDPAQRYPSASAFLSAVRDALCLPARPPSTGVKLLLPPNPPSGSTGHPSTYSVCAVSEGTVAQVQRGEGPQASDRQATDRPKTTRRALVIAAAAILAATTAVLAALHFGLQEGRKSAAVSDGGGEANSRGNGTDQREILLGMSAPFSGPAAELRPRHGAWHADLFSAPQRPGRHRRPQGTPDRPRRRL